MSTHPSHQWVPALGGCQRCGMTYEEMLDFPDVHCDDAREAQLPCGAQPGTFGPALTGQSALQRALMLVGLGAMAPRQNAIAQTDRNLPTCAARKLMMRLGILAEFFFRLAGRRCNIRCQLGWFTVSA